MRFFKKSIFFKKIFKNKFFYCYFHIFKTLNEFDLNHKVLSITTDNAPNMVSGMEYLQADHTINSIIHMRCSAHILNLAVKSGLDCKEISQSISKIRYVCKKVNASSKLEADLTAHQKACKEKELSVSLDIEIRWNSTFDMIDRAMKIRKSLTAISKDLNDEKPEENILLDLEDFNNASLVLEILEPFNQSN